MFPFHGNSLCGSCASSTMTSTNVPSGELLVDLRRREVHVARHELAAADHDLALDLLGRPPLVGRQDVLVAVDFPHRVDETDVRVARGRRGAGAFVGGPLVRTHGRRARVREEVDRDVGRTEEERVPAGLADRPLPLLAGPSGRSARPCAPRKARSRTRTVSRSAKIERNFSSSCHEPSGLDVEWRHPVPLAEDVEDARRPPGRAAQFVIARRGIWTGRRWSRPTRPGTSARTPDVW